MDWIAPMRVLDLDLIPVPDPSSHTYSAMIEPFWGRCLQS
jgi:hypothetical protein